MTLDTVKATMVCPSRVGGMKHGRSALTSFWIFARQEFNAVAYSWTNMYEPLIPGSLDKRTVFTSTWPSLMTGSDSCCSMNVADALSLARSNPTDGECPTTKRRVVTVLGRFIMRIEWYKLCFQDGRLIEYLSPTIEIVNEGMRRSRIMWFQSTGIVRL